MAQLPQAHGGRINYVNYVFNGTNYATNGIDGRPARIDVAGKAVVAASATKARSLKIEYLPATSLPPSIWNLTVLKELDLTLGLALTQLSENIGNLQQLTKLSVVSPLESLPTGIGRLPKLTTLNLVGGSYETLPPAVHRIERFLAGTEDQQSQGTR